MKIALMKIVLMQIVLTQILSDFLAPFVSVQDIA